MLACLEATAAAAAGAATGATGKRTANGALTNGSLYCTVEDDEDDDDEIDDEEMRLRDGTDLTKQKQIIFFLLEIGD